MLLIEDVKNLHGGRVRLILCLRLKLQNKGTTPVERWEAEIASASVSEDYLKDRVRDLSIEFRPGRPITSSAPVLPTRQANAPLIFEMEIQKTVFTIRAIVGVLMHTCVVATVVTNSGAEKFTFDLGSVPQITELEKHLSLVFPS